MNILLRLSRYLRNYWRQLTVAFLCLVASTFFSLVIPRLLGESIDRVLAKGDYQFLIMTALGIVLASILRGIFSYWQSYLSELVSQRVAYDLRNALYNHLQHLSFAFHDRQQTGQLMSRATADVEGVRWLVSWGVVRSVYLLVIIILVTLFLLSMNWGLALASLAFVPLVASRAIIVSTRLREIWQRIQEKTGDLTTALQENLSGMRVVKAYAREGHESQKFAQKAGEVANETLLANRVQASNAPLMNLIFTLSMGLILWYGGREVMAGRLTPGELTQFIFYLTVLAMPVRMTGFIVNVYSRAISSGQRIFEILDAQSPVKESPEAIELPSMKGYLRFENVSFNYDSVSPILHNVSFEVEPTQVIALLGATGSGKSTIVHLIPRFYDVSSGRITIDGVDVRDFKLTFLRRNVGIVQQDVFLFSATIRENLAYGATNASQEEIIAAAKAARLHDFIQGLPDGYETWVGERGITLSGGQKQRLAIARTLLVNPRILILDDSTSSVDIETENLIQEALAELVKGRTTFIISQRLSTVRLAGHILVLKDDMIVERGTPQELLARDSTFRELYKLQLSSQSI
ncbi:MAG: ABC transporter ATP-binding protein [Chloroflexi bacterium]|nr:ABC transporter ATP-binding protein [Chloroflexota bacterium]